MAFYWVTAVAEDEPDVIEIRRCGGTGTWKGEPGEDRLALSGERGGLWLMSGRSPQARMGVGFCGQGFDRGAPYTKTKAAASPQWSWIFAGVKCESFGGVQRSSWATARRASRSTAWTPPPHSAAGGR